MAVNDSTSEARKCGQEGAYLSRGYTKTQADSAMELPQLLTADASEDLTDCSFAASSLTNQQGGLHVVQTAFKQRVQPDTFKSCTVDASVQCLHTSLCQAY